MVTIVAAEVEGPDTEQYETAAARGQRGRVPAAGGEVAV